MQLNGHLAQTSGLTVDMFSRWLELAQHRRREFTGPVAECAKTDAIQMAADI